jgi:hypothetical protein
VGGKLFYETDAIIELFGGPKVPASGIGSPVWNEANSQIEHGAQTMGLIYAYSAPQQPGVRSAGIGSRVGENSLLVVTHDEATTISKHTAAGSSAMRDIRRGRSAHVFNEGINFETLISNVWTEGQYIGVLDRDKDQYQRFVWKSPTAIGIRLQTDQPDVLLHWVEIKVNPKGKYHLVPRTRPAK